MKKSISIIALILLSSLLVFGQNKIKSIESRLQGIDAELKKVLDTWHVAGFAVAVVEKNKIVYAQGFGYKDLENKSPVDANTLFAIGSCTKAFTASLMGCLEKEGRLSLDDKPSKYVPGLNFLKPQMNEFIQIKDIITHRTGLPRHDFSWYMFPSASKDSLIQRLAYQEPIAEVREEWHYNNFMYLLQGLIAEKITQKSWEENIRERFFLPLSMNRSNLSIDEMRKSSNISIGYNTDKNNVNQKTNYYHLQGMGPAGSINSSVMEMGNWLITWINGGKFQGKELLPLSYVLDAQSSQMVINAALPQKENPSLHFDTYGYGWFLSSYKGHYRVEHGGNIDGFSASTCFYPSDSIGIVVLTNQNQSFVPSVVRDIIADRVLELNTTDWNKKFRKQYEEGISKLSSDSDSKKDTKTSHPLYDFQGSYHHPGYGTLQIAVENDSLFAKGPINKIYLRNYHYDVFETFLAANQKIDTTNSLGIKLNFFIDNAGNIAGFRSVFEPGIDPLEFKRIPVSEKLNMEALQIYVGEYELLGMTAKVYNKGDVLYLFVPGQSEYELVSTGKNKFALKIAEGYRLEFVEGGQGQITDAILIQPNGTFKAKKK